MSDIFSEMSQTEQIIYCQKPDKCMSDIFSEMSQTEQIIYCIVYE